MTPSVATADEPVTATTTKLTVSPGVSIPGDTVEFTVDVTADDGARPSGYFAVSIPGWGSSHGRVVNGTAVVQHVAGHNWPEIAPGTYTATARFTPDNTYAESISSPVTFTVASAPAPTHTAVSLSQNPVVAGQSTLVTATVGSTVPGQVATGVVSFSVNGQHLANVSLFGGTASTPFVPRTAGNYVITAFYTGEGTMAPSSSTAILTAMAPLTVPTTTTVTGSPDSAMHGDPVELTASVSAVLPALARSSDPMPTGTVEFREGSTSLGTATLDDGTASLTLSNLAPGTHRITARYSGADGFDASDSEDPFTVTITARPMSIASRTTVSASPDRVEAGSEVALVADVSPLPVERPAPASARAADASAPTGSVEFFVDGASVGTASLSDGIATLKTSSLAVGTHRITAAYRGDDVFASSESDQAATVTVVAKPSVKPTPTPKPTAKPGATTAPSKTQGGAQLATTGADPTGSLVLGGVLLVAGSVLTLIHVRRRAAGTARATAQ
ncbi:Ig-like domain-containing protein [Leucobacter iarius]